jgi:Ser/Thr protein kinase RdoA (MazF antagonist)
MLSMFSHLNQPEVDSSYAEAIRRAIGHLGKYIELIVQPLKLRPTGAALLMLDATRVEVRVNSPSGNVIVVIGSDADIAGELYWLRMLATRNLPASRLIHADLTGTIAPFSYLIVAYIGGEPLHFIADPALIKIAARATGRVARRMHQIPAPAFGRPSPADRWPQAPWPSILHTWLEQDALLERAADWLAPDLIAAWMAATVDHPDLVETEPRIIHGALGPAAALVSTGESIQLELLIRPGTLISGDPLLDVAQALSPLHPPAFRQGFLEGYAAVGPLDPTQRLKLRRFGMLCLVRDTLIRQDASELAQLSDIVAAELRHLG